MNTFNRKSYNEKIIIAILFIILSLLSSLLTLSFSVLFLQLLFISFTIPLIIKRDPKIAKIYLLIYFVSFFFVFLVYNGNLIKYDTPYYIGGSDDLMFEVLGLAVYDSKVFNPGILIDLGIVPYGHNSTFFLVYIALLIGFSEIFDGYSTFLPLIANIYYLLWVIMLLEYFLKKYAKFNDVKIRLTVLVFGITPNIQYINSHVFRDTFNLLQIFLLVYLFDKLLTRTNFGRKLFQVIIFIIIIYATYYTRTNALVFASVVCLFIIGHKLKIKKRYLLLSTVPLLAFIDFASTIRLESYIDGYSNYVSDQAGEGLSSFIFNQPLIPFGIVLRAVYAFIIPFPNFFSLFNDLNSILYDFVMLLIYIGVIFQIIATPFVVKRIIKFDWLAACFLVWFIAVISTTYTFRHIMLYYPFLCAMIVDGIMEASKNERKLIVFFSTLGALLLAIVYIFLKIL